MVTRCICTCWDPSAVSGSTGLGWESPLELELHARSKAVSWLGSIERTEVRKNLVDFIPSLMQRLMLMVLCELSHLHFSGIESLTGQEPGMVGACL